MIVLLVGDDTSVAGVIDSSLQPQGITVRRARSVAEATGELDPDLDLIVSELKIRQHEHEAEGAVEHGLDFVEHATNVLPGTPVFVVSAVADVDALARLLPLARRGDYLGTGASDPLLLFWKSSDHERCCEQIFHVRSEIDILEQIEVATGLAETTFRPDHERALRIYARRVGGNVIRATPMAGGLSGARVYRVRIEEDGARLSNVVAKLADVPVAIDEHERMRRYVAGALPPGAYPSVVDLVVAGSASSAGLFSQMAGDYDRSLLDLIVEDEPRAVSTIEQLRTMLSPWWEGAGAQSLTLGEVRQMLASDDKLAEDGIVLPEVELESRRLQVRMATQHCDLHVFNVLVNHEYEPIVIDFGKVSQAPVSFDPLTLELSLLFHPDAAPTSGKWPSTEQAREWNQLDVYLDGCPYPDVITTCRRWLVDVAAGDREIYASLYAYATRQLRFVGNNTALPDALRMCALTELTEHL